MRIRLNLATSPLENDHRFVFGAAIIATVGVIALVGLSWKAYNVRRADEARRAEVAEIQNEIDSLSQRRVSLESFFNNPNILEVRDRSAFLNALIQERSFPWTRIFMDFEAILPEGVRIVNIGPRLVAGHVELHMNVGAVSDEAKLKFLRALEKSKSFSHIALTSETRPQHSNDPDHVYLDLVAWYALVVVNWRLASSATTPGEEVRELRRRRDVMAADIRRAELIRAGLPSVETETASFMQKDLRPDTAWSSSIVEDLGTLAKDSGLQITSTHFRQKTIDKRGVDEITITISMQGAYPSLVSFINALERSNNFYLLDSLSLDSSSEGTLRLNLTLRTYFRI
jgi:Tfp pilus assembly protein PilO